MPPSEPRRCISGPLPIVGDGAVSMGVARLAVPGGLPYDARAPGPEPIVMAAMPNAA